jgi:hypothetical protein
VPNMIIQRDLQTATVKEEIRRCSSQYSARWPHSESHGATWQQQAIPKMLAKTSAYLIPNVIIVVVVQVFKVWFVSLIFKSHKRPWTYSLLYAILYFFTQFAECTGTDCK